jgi:hypothetical protein
VVSVRVTGTVLLLWSATTWYRLLRPVFDDQTDSSATLGGVAFIVSLLTAAIFSYVPDRVSLHRV